jgi:azurin
MSASSSSNPQSTGSIWSTINLVVAAALALFAGVWGALFVFGGIQTAIKVRTPKEAAPPPPPPAAAAPAVASAAPASAPAAPAVAGPAQKVALGPDSINPMAFNKKEIKVKAGQPVELTFTNTGSSAPLPHNVMVGRAGSKDSMMAASMVAMADPAGFSKGYKLDTPDLIAFTRLLNAGESETITFTPDVPGDYPFVCSFPGHASMMNGIIKAE